MDFLSGSSTTPLMEAFGDCPQTELPPIIPRTTSSKARLMRTQILLSLKTNVPSWCGHTGRRTFCTKTDLEQGTTDEGTATRRTYYEVDGTWRFANWCPVHRTPDFASDFASYLALIVGHCRLGMIGVHLQVGKQERFAAWPLTSSTRLQGDKHPVDL